MSKVILPLIVIFGIGAAAAVLLARVAERGWIWAAAFLNLLVAFNELSFAFRPAAEWIRIDLLLTVPAIAATNLGLSWYAFRSSERIAGSMLLLGVASIPILYLVKR